jgi:hypothetical protein
MADRYHRRRLNTAVLPVEPEGLATCVAVLVAKGRPPEEIGGRLSRVARMPLESTRLNLGAAQTQERLTMNPDLTKTLIKAAPEMLVAAAVLFIFLWLFLFHRRAFLQKLFSVSTVKVLGVEISAQGKEKLDEARSRGTASQAR